MKFQNFLLKVVATTGLCPLALAQITTFTPNQNEITYSFSIPNVTASTGTGPILFQIKAPTKYQWVGVGQGSQMAGANIFVLYSSSSTSNVTISPRSGEGHFEPSYNREAQISLLEGSGIEDGVMTANVRCETCSASGSWIYAYREGPPLDSSSPSAQIEFHDNYGSANLDLSNAVTNSDNPFLQFDSNSNPNSNANSPSTPSNSIQVQNAKPVSNEMLIAHGFLMSIAFVIMFPTFALITTFPIPRVIPKIHAPIQLFTLAMAIAGMGLGIKMGVDQDFMEQTHIIFGLVVMSLLILFQPAMGVLQHIHFRRTGGRGIFSHLHRWFGRIMIILGIINGGLGFSLAGIGGPATPQNAVIAYSTLAGVMGFLYLALQFWEAVQEGRKPQRKQVGSPVGNSVSP